MAEIGRKTMKIEVKNIHRIDGFGENPPARQDWDDWAVIVEGRLVFIGNVFEATRKAADLRKESDTEQ